MAQRYEVVVWQNVPKGAAGSEESAFSGSIVRRRLDDGEATGASGAFVTFNERNAGLAASYERIRRHTQPIAASVFEVRDWDAAGPDGLLIDRAGGAVPDRRCAGVEPELCAMVYRAGVRRGVGRGGGELHGGYS